MSASAAASSMALSRSPRASDVVAGARGQLADDTQPVEQRPQFVERRLDGGQHDPARAGGTDDLARGIDMLAAQGREHGTVAGLAVGRDEGEAKQAIGHARHGGCDDDGRTRGQVLDDRHCVMHGGGVGQRGTTELVDGGWTSGCSHSPRRYPPSR